MDRKTVMTWLEICGKNRDCSGCCPYGNDGETFTCKERLMEDAYDLLKEQEAKQVIKQTYHVMMNRDYENPVEVTRYDWLCPTCKSLLCMDIDVIDDNYHFCKVCGQEVKWE